MGQFFLFLDLQKQDRYLYICFTDYRIEPNFQIQSVHRVFQQ